MARLYPLRFEPLLRRYLWGGRRLASVLGKTLPPGDDFAESWEIVDHGRDQSRVASGPCQGLTLQELVATRGAELLGASHPQRQFPLLFKFLDAHQALSVQVHPGDADAARRDPPDLGKTEAWFMLHADPGSRIYAGLKAGVDRPALERAIADGTAESCLHWFEPRAGDCVFIPAGTVHALGAGLVVAEIQQASDTTLRLFDWNRVGPDGRPRPLHVREGLAVIDYQRGPVGPQSPLPTDRPHVRRLVACDKFVLDRWSFSDPQPAGGDDRFHILAVVEGAVSVAGDPTDEPLVRGQTLLLPASLGPVRLTPHAPAVLLDMYLPLALAYQST
jgi:mannose-6-phosphate isomerase